MNNFNKFLIAHNACEPSQPFTAGKTFAECYATCERGDWLLWLFALTNPEDVRLRVLVAGHCANTVRHLMKDKRSIAAVDGAIAFGEGRIDKAELEVLAGAAGAAYADAAANAARAAAYAARGAANAVDAADASADAAADAAAYAVARKANQRLTADIVRKYIPIEKWDITAFDKVA